MLVVILHNTLTPLCPHTLLHPWCAVLNATGRGLFTTKAVLKGQLLLAERAFAFTLGDASKILFSIDTADKGRTGESSGAVNSMAKEETIAKALRRATQSSADNARLGTLCVVLRVHCLSLQLCALLLYFTTAFPTCVVCMGKTQPSPELFLVR